MFRLCLGSYELVVAASTVQLGSTMEASRLLFPSIPSSREAQRCGLNENESGLLTNGWPCRLSPGSKVTVETAGLILMITFAERLNGLIVFEHEGKSDAFIQTVLPAKVRNAAAANKAVIRVKY